MKSLEFDFNEHYAEREAIKIESGINDIEACFTESEMWRVICEARHCLDFYSLEERRGYLDLVLKHRGEAGRKYLEEAILAEWKRRK